MKKIIIIICFFFIGEAITAQTSIIGTNFTYQQISENEYNFTFHTFFSCGAGSTCPPFVNYTVTIIGDTLYVKAYYDTTGIWPAMGCGRTDTVIYNNSLPQNVTYIKMSTNAITYNNTPPYDPPTMTIEDLYFHIFDLNLSNNNFNTKNKYNLYPNPTQGYIFISNDIDFEKIAVINNLGQIIVRLNKNNSGNYDFKDIPDGLYNIVFYDKTNKKIGDTKILKRN
jgi:hypothetical protein